MTDITYVDSIRPASGSTFSINGVTISDTVPTNNQILTATSSSNAEWQSGVPALKTTGTAVDLTASSVPSAGDVLYASSPTTGDWTLYTEKNISNVRVATTEAITLNDMDAGFVIDGITLVEGDRVLVKDNNSIENGIYTVNADTVPPTRTTDFDTGKAVSSLFMFVSEGTLNGKTGFICTNNTGNDIVNTDILNFRIFGETNSTFVVSNSLGFELAIFLNVNHIKLLSGTYTSSTLSINSNTLIEGLGNVIILDTETEIDTVENITIKNITYDNNGFNDGITIDGTSSNIKIINCKFIGTSTNPRNLSIFGGTNITIEDCSFSIDDTQIDILNTNPIDNVRIINCKFNGITSVGNKYIQATLDATSVLLIDGCIFENNPNIDELTFTNGYITIINSITNGIIKNSGNLIFKNNIVKNSDFIRINSDADAVVSGNFIDNLEIGIDVNIVSTQKVIISNNFIKDCFIGIRVLTSNSNCLIQNNVLNNSNGSEINYNINITDNKGTKVIDNNAVRVQTDNIDINGFDDNVSFQNFNLDLTDCNFGSAGHIIIITCTDATPRVITPITTGLQPNNTSYSSLNFNTINSFAILQWTGLSWNILEVSAGVVINP